MTKNVKGLMNALSQAVNEAVLESKDVAAAMAALRRTGRCPVLTIDVTMQEELEPAAAPARVPAGTASARKGTHPLNEDLVLSDADVDFLTELGIRDPSWCSNTPQAGTA